MVEWLRHRSCEQKVPISIPRSGISVDVTSQCYIPYVSNVVCDSLTDGNDDISFSAIHDGITEHINLSNIFMTP